MEEWAHRWRLIRRRLYPRLAAVLAVTLIVGCGVAGYLIGNSQGVDIDAAERAAKIAGDRQGSREGYAQTFSEALHRAYRKAYREAYTAAYLNEFAEAGVAAPHHVRVHER
jgi:flagellar biosynthesis/type III secretory pathway protein FliH